VQGASPEVCKAYAEMKQDPSIQLPLSWTDPSFTLDPYSLIFLPGGHDKGVRQVIDSARVHELLAAYWPQTEKPSKKGIAAICHGVMVLSETGGPDGKSVLHEAETTALPGKMESGVFWGTRMFLGDYYKTYGAGSDNVETSVRSLQRFFHH
jgi:putative intracellular protease/amidase